MKKALIIVLLFSKCSPGVEESTIADFVQTAGNVRTDLSFDLESLALIDTIYGFDSLQYWASVLVHKGPNQTGEELIEYYHKGIESTLKLLDEYQLKIDSLETIESTLTKAKFYEQYPVSSMKQLYVGFYQSSGEAILKRRAELKVLEHYDSLSSKPMALKYAAIYNIKNPQLSNATQQITRTFYLSIDGKQVLKAE